MSEYLKDTLSIHIQCQLICHDSSMRAGYQSVVAQEVLWKSANHVLFQKKSKQTAKKWTRYY